MRQAGRLASRILDRVSEVIRPGISTADIDRLVDRLTVSAGARSAPHRYQGTFPGHCCTSVNHVVCHGIPSETQILKAGDIINVDVTPVLRGFHGDASRTFIVEEASQSARDLVMAAREALWIGIGAVGPGKRIEDIGRAVDPFVSSLGYSVVREFSGHGIGRQFHCFPTVFHHIASRPSVELVPGMAFTVEPMINLGSWKTRILDDGWTAVAIDGKLSAQFEHTVLVTGDGVEILTLGENEEIYPASQSQP